MNEQIINQLQSLNLSLSEAKVYSALLEIGQTSAGEIIKTTLLHSATEPMIIEVKNKTLVKVFQNNFDILWNIGKPL